MTSYDQAARWLANQSPAVSGAAGHNQTFSVACCLAHGFQLGAFDVGILMAEYNSTCQPPWSATELAHKVQSAIDSTPSKPRGYMLRGISGKRDRLAVSDAKSITPSRKSDSGAKRAASREILDCPSTVELPDPIPDGARVLLREVFRAGEGIRIAHARLNDEAREIPSDGGVVLSREEWLRKLAEVDGNPNGLFSSSKNTGIYISINPMRLGGDKDADVTDYRHALIEFDNLSREEQWNLYEKSKLPCAAIISSGGKSIHAWVRVDARDRSEYDARVKSLYSYFADSGLEIDTKNKNPSRFSRLPNCVRFNKRQELLALNTGAASFTEWLIQVECAGIGEEKTMQYLLDYKPAEDPNAIIGKRWLCRGGSCLIIGPSGFGKSSLEMQMAGHWACGVPFCGIAPVAEGQDSGRKLKSLIIQAENDDGDLAESAQGVYGSMGGDMLADAERDAFRRNIVVETVTSHTGSEFIAACRRLVDKHRPDICWLDPFAAFAGDDIGKQTTIAQFCRNGLNPIAHATGVVWMVVNHIPKPSNDPKIKARQDQYSGAGSYDLPGWARAVMVLTQVGPAGQTYTLRLTKRGKRAGATHPSGQPTEVLYLQHATDGVYWVQVDPPAEPVYEPKKKAGRPLKEFIFSDFLESIKGETFTYKELIERGADFGDISKSYFVNSKLPELKKLGLKSVDGKWTY